MKNFLKALLFLVSMPLCAQIPSGYVQTTATVPVLANGTYGASWTNLSSSPQLGLLGCVSTFQTTVNGTFDASGHFSVLLADTAQICPTPSTWTFTLTFSCPTNPTSAFQVAVPVTGGGGTENITSQITAALPTNPCSGSGGGGGGYLPLDAAAPGLSFTPYTIGNDVWIDHWMTTDNDIGLATQQAVTWAAANLPNGLQGATIHAEDYTGLQATAYNLWGTWPATPTSPTGWTATIRLNGSMQLVSSVAQVMGTNSRLECPGNADWPAISSSEYGETAGCNIIPADGYDFAANGPLLQMGPGGGSTNPRNMWLENVNVECTEPNGTIDPAAVGIWNGYGQEGTGGDHVTVNDCPRGVLQENVGTFGGSQNAGPWTNLNISVNEIPSEAYLMANWIGFGYGTFSKSPVPVSRGIENASIVPPNATIPAACTPTLTGTAITSCPLTAHDGYTGGNAYITVPTVTFSTTNGSGGTATANLTATSVGAVYLTTVGIGCTSAPAIAFSGGGGTGAAATAVLVDTQWAWLGADISYMRTGTVDHATVTGGSGYTTPPTVTFSGGGCSTEPTGGATLSPTTVASITITAGGSYSAAPTADIALGGGSPGNSVGVSIDADSFSVDGLTCEQGTYCVSLGNYHAVYGVHIGRLTYIGTPGSVQDNVANLEIPALTMQGFATSASYDAGMLTNSANQNANYLINDNLTQGASICGVDSQVPGTPCYGSTQFASSVAAISCSSWSGYGASRTCLVPQPEAGANVFDSRYAQLAANNVYASGIENSFQGIIDNLPQLTSGETNSETYETQYPVWCGTCASPQIYTGGIIQSYIGVSGTTPNIGLSIFPSTAALPGNANLYLGQLSGQQWTSITAGSTGSPTSFNLFGLFTPSLGMTVPSGGTLTIASGATLTCASGSTCPSSGGITLTTTGTSGAATLTGGTLNIPVYSGGGGSGTVTSVALVGSGNLFSATAGTAVTSSGNLNMDSQLAAQAANCILAGPASGSSAAPTCRTLVTADLPSGVALTGTVNTFTQNQIITGSGTDTILELNNSSSGGKEWQFEADEFGSFELYDNTDSAAILVATNALFTFEIPVATPSIAINSGTPITSASSANSQVVTCPTGGTGTEVCDANGTWIASNTPVTNTTISVGTTTIPANGCLPTNTTYNTASMPGVTTLSTFTFTPAASLASVTGWTPAGPIPYFNAYPTANTLNWQICNNSTPGITPGSSTTWNVSAK